MWKYFSGVDKKSNGYKRLSIQNVYYITIQKSQFNSIYEQSKHTTSYLDILQVKNLSGISDLLSNNHFAWYKYLLDKNKLA